MKTTMRLIAVLVLISATIGLVQCSVSGDLTTHNIYYPEELKMCSAKCTKYYYKYIPTGIPDPKPARYIDGGCWVANQYQVCSQSWRFSNDKIYAPPLASVTDYDERPPVAYNSSVRGGTIGTGIKIFLTVLKMLKKSKGCKAGDYLSERSTWCVSTGTGGANSLRMWYPKAMADYYSFEINGDAGYVRVKNAEIGVIQMDCRTPSGEYVSFRGYFVRFDIRSTYDCMVAGVRYNVAPYFFTYFTFASFGVQCYVTSCRQLDPTLTPQFLLAIGPNKEELIQRSICAQNQNNAAFQGVITC